MDARIINTFLGGTAPMLKRLVLCMSLIFCLAAVGLLPGCNDVAYTGEEARVVDKQLLKLPEDSLASLAARYIKEAATADSASICFMILADRTADATTPEGIDRNVNANICLGYIFMTYMDDYHRAYDYLRLSEEKTVAAGCDRYLPYIYLNEWVSADHCWEISGNWQGDNHLSTRLLEKALAKAVETNEWRVMSTIFHNLVHSSIENDPRRLRKYYDAYRKVHIPRQDPLSEYTKQLMAGVEKVLAGDYLAAAQQFDRLGSKALTKDEPMGRELRNSSLFFKAVCLEKAGKTKESEQTLESLCQTVDSADAPSSRMWINAVLYKFHQRHGNAEEAMRHKMAYYEAKEDIMRNSSVYSVDGISFLSKLRNVREEVAEEKERSRQMQWTLMGLAVIFVITIVFLVSYTSVQRKRRRAIQSLYEKNMELFQGRKDDSEPGACNLVEDSVSAAQQEASRELAEKIAQVFATPSVICSTDFSLDELSRLVGSNTTYVSNVLNACFNQNFYSVLCQRRIAEAVRILSTRSFDNLTIEAVAEMVGIKSRSNFSALFKKSTGMSPSEFRKMSQKN